MELWYLGFSFSFFPPIFLLSVGFVYQTVCLSVIYFWLLLLKGCGGYLSSRGSNNGLFRIKISTKQPSIFSELLLFPSFNQSDKYIYIDDISPRTLYILKL